MKKTSIGRNAIQAAAAALAALMFIPSNAFGKDGAVPPSERFNVGLIWL